MKNMLFKILLTLFSVTFLNSMQKSTLPKLNITPKRGISSYLPKPLSLKLLSAMQVKEINKSIPEEVMELYKKVKEINECSDCTNHHKAFLLYLLDNPDIKVEELREFFQDLINKYPNSKFTNLSEFINYLLMTAVADGRVKLLKHLIKLGANVNTVDAVGNTPLILATMRNDKKIVKILLQNGADLETKGQRGLSALMLAQDASIIRLLIEKGANPNLPNGRTILDLAMSKGRMDLVEMLANLLGYEDTVLNKAALIGNPEMVDFFLKKGIDVNTKLRDISALNSAIQLEYLPVIELLLNRGAKIENLDLEYADSKDPKILEMLKNELAKRNQQ